MSSTRNNPFTRRRRRTRDHRLPTGARRGQAVGADEKLLQRMLAKVGARPIGHADPLAGDPARPDETAPSTPPTAGWPPAGTRPRAHAGETAPSDARPRGAARLPDWRLPDKPELPLPDPTDGPDTEPAETQPDIEPQDSVPKGWPGLGGRVRAWVNSAGERVAGRPPAAVAETGEDHDGDGDEVRTGDDPDGHHRPRPGDVPRPRRRGRRPPFAAPGLAQVLRPAQDRRSLIEAIRSTPPHVVWLFYSGSALGVGLWRGWPQWVRDGIAYLVSKHPTLTDTYSLTCYAIAAGVLLLDYQARAWIWPLAWAARIPSACLVAGVAMYGDPTPISQMTF